MSVRKRVEDLVPGEFIVSANGELAEVRSTAIEGRLVVVSTNRIGRAVYPVGTPVTTAPSPADEQPPA